MHAHHPNEVAVGVDREDLDKFDDLSVLKKFEPPYTIKEIDIEFNDKHLLGVEFKYECHDEKKHVGHKAMRHKHAKHHQGVFTIDKDDELLEIGVWADVRINGLDFKTYKGKHHEFGHKEGNHVVHKFVGCTFGAVKGGYAEHLDYLVFQVHPLPLRNKDLVPKH